MRPWYNPHRHDREGPHSRRRAQRPAQGHGWTITADPYTIKYQDVVVYADLAAERPFAAERAGRRIVVEVKSFLSPSAMHDLELALGQFQVYRVLLERTAPERELFLAVPEVAYASFLSQPAIQLILNESRVVLLVVDPDRQEIVKWTK
jgi:hypothetical protein